MAYSWFNITGANTLSSNAEFDHHIDGKKVKPEGFVVVRNNRPTKFVDRKEFSAANFNRPKPGAAENG